MPEYCATLGICLQALAWPRASVCRRCGCSTVRLMPGFECRSMCLLITRTGDAAPSRASPPHVMYPAHAKQACCNAPSQPSPVQVLHHSPALSSPLAAAACADLDAHLQQQSVTGARQMPRGSPTLDLRADLHATLSVLLDTPSRLHGAERPDGRHAGDGGGAVGVRPGQQLPQPTGGAGEPGPDPQLHGALLPLRRLTKPCLNFRVS